MPIVLKSGSLNLLEPSGPVQACNGIAFAFTTTLARAEGRTWTVTICARYFVVTSTDELRTRIRNVRIRLALLLLPPINDTNDGIL